MTILVTGAAGFVGYHTALALLGRGETVVGVDSMNSYYDVTLKEARLADLNGNDRFTFHQSDIADRDAMDGIVRSHPDITGIIHLAAQAGVRYSLIDPYAYAQANVMGQVVMLEAALKLRELRHFVYASSSSVYGANRKQPFSVEDPVNEPVSLYAATKRADELITRTYAHLHGLKSTGLRFFTVYGPFGRPDMAYFSFTRALFEGTPIKVFNHGRMKRDFTYIDDVVAGVLAALDRPPEGETVPHRLYNLGNNRPETLGDFIATLEELTGRTAVKDMHPMQPGDVEETYADIDASTRDLGFEPTTGLKEGLGRFVDWYRSYYGVL